MWLHSDWAPAIQRDKAPGFEPLGPGYKSLRARGVHRHPPVPLHRASAAIASQELAPFHPTQRHHLQSIEGLGDKRYNYQLTAFSPAPVACTKALNQNAPLRYTGEPAPSTDCHNTTGYTLNRTGFSGGSISWEDGVHGKTKSVLT